MHSSAMENGKTFFETYSDSFAGVPDVKVVDIGAQDVNGSLRDVCPERFEYVGVDFEDANGVDIVLDDPYSIPIETSSVDIVVSSSCFEHSELFWLTFLEAMRMLKPHGLLYINVPSTGSFHQYPLDCWRFYPDAGRALVTWAKRNDLDVCLLESFCQLGGAFQDFVAVFVKDGAEAARYPLQMLKNRTDFENGQAYPKYELLNPARACQNEAALAKALFELENSKSRAVEYRRTVSTLEKELEGAKQRLQDAQEKLDRSWLRRCKKKLAKLRGK